MSSPAYIRWQTGIEERASHTPTMLKHCVADVAGKQGGDTHRAFAICTASLQKAGELKAGSNTATKKGKAKGAAHAKEPGAEKKVADYEKLLAAARKSESSEGVSLEQIRALAGLGESKRPKPGDWVPPAEGGLKNAPIGSIRHLAAHYGSGAKKHAWIKTSHDGLRGWKYLGKPERHPEHTPQHESDAAPDMAKFFSDPENFWRLVGYGGGPNLGEWGGGNERPDPKWANPAAVPPQDTVAQEDDDAPAASWKKSIAKESPNPKKGHQYEPDIGQHEAYQTLEQALSGLELPTSDGKTRKVDPKEFAYRGQHMDDNGKTSWMHFKHKHTRNHVHLDLENKTVVVPKSRMPFKRGEFDKVENAETLERLRLLAGIE